MLAQVLRRLLRVEDDRGVEEAEEDDQRRRRAPCAAAGRSRASRMIADEPVRAALAGEARHGRRQEQQRAGEDRRDDARGVELERQVRALAAEHAVALLALGVLDQDAPLRPLHEDDEGDDRDRHHEQEDDEQRRHRAGAAELEQCSTSACGRLATMPMKMISEMPLPMPRAVICSPSHIRNRRAADDGDDRRRCGRTSRDRSPPSPAGPLIASRPIAEPVGLERGEQPP